MWYDPRRKFGYIKRADGRGDVRVVQNAIKGCNQDHQEPTLHAGEEVEFELRQGTRKPTAANVTGPNGAQLRGSQLEPRPTHGGGTATASPRPQPQPQPEPQPSTRTTATTSPQQRPRPRTQTTATATSVPELGFTDPLGPLPFQGEQSSSENSSPLTSRGKGQRKTNSPSSSASPNRPPLSSASKAPLMELTPGCSSTPERRIPSSTRTSSEEDD